MDTINFLVDSRTHHGHNIRLLMNIKGMKTEEAGKLQKRLDELEKQMNQKLENE